MLVFEQLVDNGIDGGALTSLGRLCSKSSVCMVLCSSPHMSKDTPNGLTVTQVSNGQELHRALPIHWGCCEVVLGTEVAGLH